METNKDEYGKWNFWPTHGILGLQGLNWLLTHLGHILFLQIHHLTNVNFCQKLEGSLHPPSSSVLFHVTVFDMDNRDEDYGVSNYVLFSLSLNVVVLFQPCIVARWGRSTPGCGKYSPSTRTAGGSCRLLVACWLTCSLPPGRGRCSWSPRLLTRPQTWTRSGLLPPGWLFLPIKVCS